MLKYIYLLVDSLTFFMVLIVSIGNLDIVAFLLRFIPTLLLGNLNICIVSIRNLDSVAFLLRFIPTLLLGNLIYK